MAGSWSLPELRAKRGLRVVGAAVSAEKSTLRAVRMLTQKKYPFHKLHSHRFGLDQVENAIRLLGGEIAGETPSTSRSSHKV